MPSWKKDRIESQSQWFTIFFIIIVTRLFSPTIPVCFNVPVILTFTCQSTFFSLHIPTRHFRFNLQFWRETRRATRSHPAKSHWSLIGSKDNSIVIFLNFFFYSSTIRFYNKILLQLLQEFTTKLCHWFYLSRFIL